jgi:hypothetical protein
MGALLFVGLVIAVLVLCSKLSETRYQLRQTRHERDVYERIYNDAMFDLTRSTLPRNYSEIPERRES